MNMKNVKTLCMTLAMVLVASVAFSASAALPSAKLRDMKGRVVDAANISNNGKPIIISFFAKWCKPCKRELAAIHEVYPDWQEETGVKVIAVSIDKAQDISETKNFVNGQGWDFDVLFDSNEDFKRAMGIQQIPHMLIIDGNGKIVESRSGYTDGAESEVIKKLREITTKSAKKAKK